MNSSNTKTQAAADAAALAGWVMHGRVSKEYLRAVLGDPMIGISRTGFVHMEGADASSKLAADIVAAVRAAVERPGVTIGRSATPAECRLFSSES